MVRLALQGIRWYTGIMTKYKIVSSEDGSLIRYARSNKSASQAYSIYKGKVEVYRCKTGELVSPCDLENQGFKSWKMGKWFIWYFFGIVLVSTVFLYVVFPLFIAGNILFSVVQVALLMLMYWMGRTEGQNYIYSKDEI